MLGKIKQLLSGKRYFIVTSHGNTGTMWLAMNLNEHEKVFCTHSYQFPIIEPAEKLRIEKCGVNLLDNINANFWTLKLDDFFDQQERATKKPINGNVHAFIFARLWQMLPELSYQRKRNLAVMNMMRHPITRINSCYHHWLEGDANKFKFIDLDIKNNCKHILEFLSRRKHTVEPTYENKAFIVALLQSEHVAADVLLANKNGVPHIKFEEMTKSPDQYNMIFKHLTKNENPNKLISSGDHKHGHNPDSKLSAHNQYDIWQDWKKDAFDFVFHNSNMATIYKDEYNLSFVGTKPRENVFTCPQNTNEKIINLIQKCVACGSDAKIEEVKYDSSEDVGAYYVGCTNCGSVGGCKLILEHQGETHQEAIKAWNELQIYLSCAGSNNEENKLGESKS